MAAQEAYLARTPISGLGARRKLVGTGQKGIEENGELFFRGSEGRSGRCRRPQRLTSGRHSGFFLDPVTKKRNGTVSRSTGSRNAGIPSSPNSPNPSNGKDRIMRDVAGALFHAMAASTTRGSSRKPESGRSESSGFQARGRADAQRIPDASTLGRRNAMDLMRRPLRALRAAEAASSPQGFSASSRSPGYSDSPLKERGTSGERSGRPASRLRIYGHYRDNRKNGRSDRGNPLGPPPREKVPEIPFTPNRNPYTVFGTGPTAP